MNDYFFNTEGFTVQEGFCAADPMVISCTECGERLAFSSLHADPGIIEATLNEHRASCSKTRRTA